MFKCPAEVMPHSRLLEVLEHYPAAICQQDQAPQAQ